ncbi:MAG: SAM-dependent DNA methyltransferase, partial [Calditrichaeota bacterium]|nr:SAM-dependent DNA methyltransferase [Calditrichota bacterium]
SVTIDEIRQHGYVLTPGRYVGAEVEDEDDEPFHQKTQLLTAQLRQQMAEARRLDEAIWKNLEELGYGG